MRTPSTNVALSGSISLDRLSKYLAETNGDLDQALALYERNTRLSEAFYGPLQCMEVCLRNKLSAQLEKAYGASWLLGTAVPLDPDAFQAIAKAIDSIKPKPVTPGAVIAELSFSFWVGLMGPRYDATLWRKSLQAAFRADGKGKARGLVHGRFNALRRLRNRIAHHEPIFQRPLPKMHSELMEAIGWMCSETQAWALHHSRFEDVFNS